MCVRRQKHVGEAEGVRVEACGIPLDVLFWFSHPLFHFFSAFSLVFSFSVFFFFYVR